MPSSALSIPSSEDWGEIRVLGSYVPSEYWIDRIEAEVRALPWLPPCCRRERIGIRMPEAERVPPEPNLCWHQDGGGPDGNNRHMVVWASEAPTELQSSDGTTFTGQPFDVVWYDNYRVFHRQPRGTHEATRWFWAIRCSGAL